MREVRVQPGPFDAGAELGRLVALGGGGVASFIGVVRGDGGLTELLLEHHPTMTHAMLADLADRAAARWSLAGVVLVHRHGPLAPGDSIVLVATAAAHRQAALESCASLIDQAKTRAPFWKRETFADGRVRWVEARAEDDRAAARWG